nr:copia protein [Tanacetum cinerariifolium]
MSKLPAGIMGRERVGSVSEMEKGCVRMRCRGDRLGKMYSKMGKRTNSKPKPDKIKHEMESVEKSIKSKPKPESNQSKPGMDLERARKTEAKGINILLGRPVPELMGRVNPICIFEIENHFTFDTSSINSQASARSSFYASLGHDPVRVNAASATVTAVGPNPTNSTNSCNAASPSDNAVSSNFEIGGKSSFVDPSQYPDDPDMPALEDIVYSDDEENVGVEADLSNLETNISVSPIPTTRVHKDHPITQIISDLTLAPQTRSMARMGHTQEEGIDYEEVFAPVARIKAIRLFLAYASFMGFMVYQMDVKSVFLYRTIKEEVYVCQPSRFKDLDYPDKVYKVVKALYGLHQAPRAWYETLANYLLDNGFQRGKIDQTLFIKKQKGDILLVQVNVDDIIFGSTNKELCKAFEKLMKDKFQMSSEGELTFFWGLQVKKKDDGIFISQDKYVAKILRKFGLT